MTQETVHVLDPCCGSRMMWFDKADPRAIFGDRRSETITVTDRSHREDGTRTLTIEPDVLLDFRALPYPDDRNLRGKPRGSARGSSEQAGTACGATSVASGQLACEVQQGQPHQPLPTAMLLGE